MNMAEAMREGFRALVDITADEALKARLDKKLEALFSEKREDREYAEAFDEIERELVAHSDGHLTETDVRNRVKRSFASAHDEFPKFGLLFMSDERQYMSLVNELIGEYAKEWSLFYGKVATDRALAAALDGTPWERMEIDVEKGITFDPVRMRSVRECGEITFALFDGWFRRGRLMFGEEAGIRSFERAYRKAIGECCALRTSKKILGAMPLKVLADEKAKRIRDLESTTTSQEKSIRAADEDLRRQAERLQRTVDELSETKEKLVKTSRARSEFITVVSHQFRTPLSSIRWNAELMTDAAQEGTIPEEFNEAIDMMRTKSVYLIETLDRVFTTLDIDTGELHLDLKNAFLWEVVQDVHGKFEKEIERKGLKWKFRRRKEQLKEIPMDKEKLSTVLRILISNAIMYSEEGGAVTVDITQKKVDKKDFQVVSIADKGIGIPKDALERIFEKFYRSKPSVLKIADGTGLGMYVSKHVIEAHGGTISVESEGEGKGTTITFMLPVEPTPKSEE